MWSNGVEKNREVDEEHDGDYVEKEFELARGGLTEMMMKAEKL